MSQVQTSLPFTAWIMPELGLAAEGWAAPRDVLENMLSGTVVGKVPIPLSIAT